MHNHFIIYLLQKICALIFACVIYSFYLYRIIPLLKLLFENCYGGVPYDPLGVVDNTPRTRNYINNTIVNLDNIFLLFFVAAAFKDLPFQYTALLGWCLMFAMRFSFLLIFAAIAWFDLHTGMIPDRLNISLFCLGALYRWAIASISTLPYTWHLSGYYLTVILFISSFVVSSILSISPLRLVGGGDLKLIAALTWFGLTNTFYIVLSALVGALVWEWIFYNGNRKYIKFGPYLVVSASFLLLNISGMHELFL